MHGSSASERYLGKFMILDEVTGEPRPIRNVEMWEMTREKKNENRTRQAEATEAGDAVLAARSGEIDLGGAGT